MTSNLTMHQLGVVQEPKGLTSHRARAARRPVKKSVVPDGVNVPLVGTEIDINLDRVVFEDDDGNAKTPMTKLRYDAKTKSWQQVGANLAGLLVFFDQPPGDDCKRMRVVRVIPRGTACYVVPM